MRVQGFPADRYRNASGLLSGLAASILPNGQSESYVPAEPAASYRQAEQPEGGTYHDLLHLPDSTGKQYPVYVATTKADKDEQTTELTRTEMDAYIRQMKAIVDSLSRKVDAALQEERKVAELSWWDLHKWKVLVPVVLVIIATTFIYKYRKK